MQNWKKLDAASVYVDASVSAFDIVHISRDIAEDLDKVKNWCLSGKFSMIKKEDKPAIYNADICDCTVLS